MYFVWVKFAAPLEVLAHRIVWSVPLLALLITVGRQWSALRVLSMRQLRLLAVCSVLLSINWLSFIFAIHTERIAEAALGYYFNPLVSIVLGFVVLAERLRPAQWGAVGLAFAAVLLEVAALGEVPWLALALAFSFGFYGLLRKQLAVSSSAGLGVEATLLLPFALGYLMIAGASADAPERSLAQVLMLGLGGAVTVAPLIWFASAATRLPLTVLGFFQYLAPSISLLLAVFVYEEPVTQMRWVSFTMVWLALALLSVEALQHSRSNQALQQSDQRSPT